MTVARYKKGNKFHLVEHLFNGEPNGVIEIFDTETEALERIAAMQEIEDTILKSQIEFNQI